MRQRYDRLRSGLDNVGVRKAFTEKSLSHKDGNNTHVKSVSESRDSHASDYIYVRSHDMRAQIGRDPDDRVQHMVTVNTTTRPLWKKVVSQRYLCRQARLSCASLEYTDTAYLRKREKRLLHARKIDDSQTKWVSKERFSDSEIPSDIYYKRVSLQAGTDIERSGTCFLAATALLSRGTGIHSLNRCREIARGKRVSLLKACKNGIFKDRKSEERSLQPSWDKINSKEQDVQLTLQTQSSIKGRGVWRDFNSTFMRDGSKLRDQTILRKALLAL